MGTLPLSNRNNQMQESSIRKLAPYADAAKAAGVAVYHLNIGQPDIKTPDAMVKAYTEAPDIIAYGPSPGVESYRRKLADYYRTIGVHVGVDDIFVTTGGSEALIFAMMAVLSPGDELIIAEPYYTNYNGFAVMAGASIVPVTATIDDGFRLPSIEAFEAVITERSRAILITSPGNPTGAIFTRPQLEQLAAFAKRHNLFVLSDEVYRDFFYGEEKPASILSIPGLEEHAVMIDSVSKRFSACGARIGALVTKNRDIYSLVMKFGQARLCPPAVEQIAAERALDTPPEYLRDVVAEYKLRRDLAVEALSKIDGVVVKKPEGAFYLIAQLPVDDAEAFAIWLLRDFRLNGATTMVAPAAGFYASPGLGKNQIRIAYVLNREALGNAIHIIDEGLKEYRRLKG
ncbi:pyridoxal phosphate-dependent aminotransferase [Sediminispirochaeta bajacaliforniensis]|uniref:pyridoxal phosphate-dependent aminotransferase n=1 Tax=Sediminispirochaeta bajacaliforniensis TaxID=148 RepID=UPI0003699953|nr:pyridoxal phosphate-dependent aminotransferase [Sediminispirochaeta bajacaliforniensis]